MGDDSFWACDLFVKELNNFINHSVLWTRGFYVLGQRWGGLLESTYASLQPPGLNKLLILRSPVSIPLFKKGSEILRANLPPDSREILEEYQCKGDYESNEIEKARQVFYKQQVCIRPLQKWRYLSF